MTPSKSKNGATPTRSAGRRRVRQGLVVVNTGEGKGKTTAALGVIFRAWGRDFRIRMFQFIKHTGARFGEQRAAQKLNIPMEALGDGFTWLSKDLDRAEALTVQQWGRRRDAILEGVEDIIVLDEFTYALHYGWVPVTDVVETLKRQPDTLHVIITGRYAPKELIDCADLVTEMKLIKHPYADRRLRAQQGIEF